MAAGSPGRRVRSLLGHLRRAAPAYAVLLVALVLTLLAYEYVERNVEESRRDRFDETAPTVLAAIERRVDSYEDAMRGARGLFYASSDVEAGEWDGYAGGIGLEERYAGMRYLGYARRVEPDEKEAFEEEVRRSYGEEGLPDPVLRPGDLEDERDEYFPIAYAQPLDGANERLLGYDAYADPPHRAAMDEARDTGEPESTGKVYLLSPEVDPGSNADFSLKEGFVVYLPVYREGEPTSSVEERREALEGFVVGALEAKGLLQEVFEEQTGPPIDFEVYDGDVFTRKTLLFENDNVLRAKEPDEVLYAEEPRSGSADERRGTVRENVGLPVIGSEETTAPYRFDDLSMAGRSWSLYSEALPGFDGGGDDRLPLFVLLSGLAVSFLLFGITFMLVRSRIRTEGARQDLEDANRELESTNRELEAFSYSVSHDLRAPLRSIDGFSQILLEDYADELDKDGKDYLGRVRAASQKMGRLIDDILGLSRVTRGTMTRERVDLSSLAEEVAAGLKEERPEKSVKFSAQKGLAEWGDPRLLRVAFTNLIGNAWKFTGKESGARVEFGADEELTREGHVPVYYVRDNGAGFDMAYADKLFGAFQRLHGADEFDGTGIGLATVQRIVHRHGGRIWARAQVGRGATFYFTLRPGLRFDPESSRGDRKEPDKKPEAGREEEVKTR